MTRHCALSPQVPGHGSLHLLLMQVLSFAQSELRTHSGRHPVYGSPKYWGWQEQDPAPFRSLHMALEPHGEGSHGRLGASTGLTVTKIKLMIQMSSPMNEQHCMLLLNNIESSPHHVQHFCHTVQWMKSNWYICIQHA